MLQPLIASTDIPSVDTRQEIVDTIVGGIDKHSTGGDEGMEAAAKAIKESLDKQYGLTWQVVIGKAYGFDITSLEDNVMHCYYQGNIGVLAFKT